MLKKLKKFKKEILLVIITALIVSIAVYSLKKPELNLPYPPTPTAQFPSEFNSLTCEEVAETYMRAWSEGSDLIDDSRAHVKMFLHEKKTLKWESSQKDANGNWVDTSKIKRATVKLYLKDNKITLTGDNLMNLENQPFDITVNNNYRLAGAFVKSKEEQPRYDIAGTFMLDKTTSLLILSDTNTKISQNESFGSRSILFTCR